MSARHSAALRRILLNAASLLGAYVFPRLFTFAAVVVAARVLGPADFGAYGTAAAYAVILSILATLGMMPLLVRDLARDPGRAPELLRAAHLVKAVSGALMLLALVLLARFGLGYPTPVVAAAFLLGLGYAVGAFVENLGAWFQAIERMGVWMQASAVFGLVTGAIGATLVWTTASVVWFCAAPLLGQLAALAWLLSRSPSELRRIGRIPAGEVPRLVRALAPFAGAFVALTVFYKVDVLVLTRLRAAEEVGIYVAGYKFVDVAHALTLAAVAAVFPRLSRQAPLTSGRERWAATRVAELLLLAVVPAAALVWLLRGALVQGLFGTAYGPGVAVLALLSPALPALALNLLAGYVLATRGRMRLVAAGYGTGVGAKLALLTLLVPLHGAQGAALAMLLSEVLLAVGFLVVLRITAGAAPTRRTLAVAGGAAGLAAGATVSAPLLAPPLLAVLAGMPGLGAFAGGLSGEGIVAAALYLGAVALLYGWARVLPARERRILRGALAPGGPRGPQPERTSISDAGRTPEVLRP